MSPVSPASPPPPPGNVNARSIVRQCIKVYRDSLLEELHDDRKRRALVLKLNEGFQENNNALATIIATELAPTNAKLLKVIARWLLADAKELEANAKWFDQINLRTLVFVTKLWSTYVNGLDANDEGLQAIGTEVMLAGLTVTSYSLYSLRDVQRHVVTRSVARFDRFQEWVFSASETIARGGDTLPAPPPPEDHAAVVAARFLADASARVGKRKDWPNL